MSQGWQPNVQFVRPGEPVTAGVASRAERTLAANQQYLKALLEESQLGSYLAARDRPGDPSLKVGQAVYWDTQDGRFAPCLARVEIDPETGWPREAVEADCLGIVIAKKTGDLVDVALAGSVEVDLSQAVVDADGATAGRYYLSASVAGGLTKERPMTGRAVLYYDGQRAYLYNTASDFVLDHAHFRFDLTALPAGSVTPPAQGDAHVIGTADPTQPGWLPADDPTFNGQAPSGAKFGYNLAQHPELQRLWPPEPIESAVIEIERPPLSSQVGDVRIGGTTADPRLVQIDRNGIWWMSNCYNEAPWPADYDSSNPTQPADPSCGPAQRMRITLYFAKSRYLTNKSVVTSLQPASGSPIRVLGCDGQPAKTGDLYLALDLGLSVDSALSDGSIALKDLQDGVFKRGYMVEGVVAGNRVSITSTQQRSVTSEDGLTGSEGETLHQGILRLDLVDPLGDRILWPQIVKLGDARERDFDEIPHIGFPAGRVSAVRLRYDIPWQDLPTDPVVTLYLLILGYTSGSIPDLTGSYRVLVRPTTGIAALPGTTDEQTLNLNTAHSVNAMTYYEAVADPIPVQAGDVLYVTVQREASDGYEGEIGLIRALGVIGSAS